MSIEPLSVLSSIERHEKEIIVNEINTILYEVINEYSRKDTGKYLQKTAIIYVRQSTQSQMMHNKESLELQYGLQSKAIEHGWTKNRINVIDTDLGVSGSGKVHRDGFQDMLLRVTSGDIGIVFAYDVTRLSRNCSDWYGLLDISGFKGTLIGDSDGVYDPLNVNDRLLLGLKGQLAEFELKTIRARMNAGLMNKVKKGEVYAMAPSGYIKSPLGKIERDPNKDVQANLQLVFTVFKEKKTVTKVLNYFKENGIELVRHTHQGDVVWKEATNSALLRILKNPAYAGVYAYGRTKTISNIDRYIRAKRVIVEPEQWRVMIENNHPAYITYEDYQKNQLQIRENYAEYERRQSSGVPRTGKSLLHGLVYCGKCAHKMFVVYATDRYYYKCSHARRAKREKVCELIVAQHIDAAVSDAFIEAMNPAEIDAYNAAIALRNNTYATSHDMLCKRLERKKYEANLRERQYLAVDPDNRLVALTLEKNWEDALQGVTLAEAELKKHDRKYEQDIPIPEEIKALFREIGKNLGVLWNDENVLAFDKKKALVRTLIEQIHISRLVYETCLIRIVWKGGLVSEIKQPIRINCLKDLSNHDEFIAKFNELYALGYTDQAIAETMTTLGFRGTLDFHVTATTIKGLRLKHKMFNNARGKQNEKTIGEEYLTVTDVMKLTGKCKSWLHYHIAQHNIEALQSKQKGNIYLFPNNDEFISKLKNLGRLKHNEKVGH